MPNSTLIKRLMTKEVVYANQFHTFSQVIQLFTEFPMRHLPVVDGHNKPIGIISSNDILKLFKDPKFKGKTIDADKLDTEINITDIMTPNPRVVKDTDTISVAANLLRERVFQAVPVVDETGVLIGILSIKDVFDFYAAKMEEVES